MCKRCGLYLSISSLITSFYLLLNRALLLAWASERVCSISVVYNIIRLVFSSFTVNWMRYPATYWYILHYLYNINVPYSNDLNSKVSEVRGDYFPVDGVVEDYALWSSRGLSLM